MQYDNYELKIKKVERFFKLVFKHLPKIIISAAIVTAATVALLAARGTVTPSGDFESEIIYGEKLEYEAKAFLSDVEYEYSPAGKEDWSGEFPREAGSYKVRALAKATFGYRYGDPAEFTISAKPIEVKITSSTVIYGEDPKISAPLVYNDSIAFASFSYDDNLTMANVTAVAIVNEDGRDVTSSYDLKLTSAPILMTQRPITVDTLDATKVYDGTPLSSNAYKISSGSLVGSDRIEATFDASITEVGSAKNKAEYKVVNASGGDVTKHYKITEDGGELKVLKRELYLRTADMTEIYDTTAKQKTEYEITSASKLVDGHTASIDSWAQIVNAGTVENKFSGFKILDANGNDVTRNYDLDFTWGTLCVERRKIDVTTESDEWTYRGTPLSNTNYNVSNNLVAGHSHNRTYFTQVTDAGVYDNEITIDITDENGVSVADNYEINYTPGTLTVNRKLVTVETYDATFTYNGAIHSFGSKSNVTVNGIKDNHAWVLVDYPKVKNAGTYENKVVIDIQDKTSGDSVANNYEISYTKVGTITVDKCAAVKVKTKSATFAYNGRAQSASEYESISNLLNGQSFVVISSSSVTHVREGEVENVFTNFKIVDDNTGENVTANYEDTVFTYGTLKVNPINISFTTASAEKVYDGKPLTADKWIAIGVLAEGDSLFSGPEITGTLTNAAYVSNSYDKSGSFCIKRGSLDVTENYNITRLMGTLTVNAREIRFTTASADKVYDGKPLVAGEWLIKPGFSLAEGDILYQTPTVTGKLVDFGTVTNTFDSAKFIICNASGVDVTSNYAITEKSAGKLTVTPRPITIYSGSIDIVYDGKVHKNASVFADSFDGEAHTGLCEGHTVELRNGAIIDSFENVSDSGRLNIFDTKDIKITCNGSNIDKGNYYITYVWGTVNIDPRPIFVTTPDYEAVYDGKDHRDQYNTPKDVSDGDNEGLCEGHKFEILDDTEIMNVLRDKSGKVLSYDNVVEFLIMNGSKDVTANYDFKIDGKVTYGKITIEPRKLTVTTNGITKVYDGKDFKDDTLLPGKPAGVTVGGLCADHVLKPVASSVKTFNDVTKTEGEKNSFGYVIMCGVDEISLDNYDITELWGTVKITPRPISVITAGYTGVYDGIEHKDEKSPYGVSYNTPIDVSSGADTGLCEGHSFLVVTDTSMLNVLRDKNGNVIGFKNEVEFKIMCNGKDVTKNYDLEDDGSVTYGDVMITPRVINIITAGYTGVYDGIEHKDEKSSYGISYNTPVDVNGALCDGHYFHVSEDTSILNVLRDREGNVIGFKNELVFSIFCNDEDVTANYDLEDNGSVTFGDVMITPRPIKITTNGVGKVYDGKEFKDGTIIAETPEGETVGGLCDGHALEITDVPSFKDVIADAKNEVGFKIVCNGQTVSKSNYEIELNYATVNITPRPIEISTGSNTWKYDGYEHYCLDYTLVGGTLAEGHKANGNVEGATHIKDVGEAKNVFALQIFDEELVDRSYNYTVTIRSYGTLTIIENPNYDDEGNDGDGESGGLDDDGEIEHPGGQPSNPTTAVIVTTDRSGDVYLKLKSFGKYTGTGWEEAAVYDERILNYASAQYLTAFALENYGVPIANVTVESLTGQYLLPYYAKAEGKDIQLSDVYVTGNAEGEYTLACFLWDYQSGVSVPDALKQFEKEYYEFVAANYLDIDTYTRSKMEEFISEHKLDASDPDIIQKVATAIQNAASYNLYFPQELNDSSNKVVDFLFKYKEGICQHYASAATMVYRALGIPARYVVGFSAYAKANTPTEITQGHAWVEVYVRGLGWINVEVTGGANGENAPKPKLTIKPATVYKEYDGSPLYANNALAFNTKLSELIKQGFRYEVAVSGSRTEIGTSPSTIVSFKLFDSKGNDVTDLFDIEFEQGEVTIERKIIKIYVYKKTFEYTGKAITYTFDAKDTSVEHSVHTEHYEDGITVKITKSKISLTNVGVLMASQINENLDHYIQKYYVYDKNGNDITSECRLLIINDDRDPDEDDADYAVITITKRQIEITTASASKTYDEDNVTALTAHSCYVSKGLLAEGHEVEIMNYLGSQTAVGSSANNFYIGEDDNQYKYGGAETWQVFYMDGDNKVYVTENYQLVGHTFGKLTVY